MSGVRPLIYDKVENKTRELRDTDVLLGVGEISGGILQGFKKETITMQAGILDYQLMAVPAGHLLAFINGVESKVLINGVNIHIDGLTPGEVEDTDFLTIYY